MALEFSSKKETFPHYRKFETTFAGRPFVVETGKLCGLANGSAMIRYGETCVLCNVTMSEKPRDGIDFFPLSVEFEEKLYAAGRIPGSFMRREGRPGEHAILSSRVVDRPIRPLFPKDMRNDVCVTMTVMSLDPDNSAEIAGMNGASLAIAMSDIPWKGPIAGISVGLVDGEIVLNPTEEQRKVSDLSLTLAASMEKIVMIEAGANEVDEATMMAAIKAGHAEIKKMLEFINSIVAEIGKPKIEFTSMDLDYDLLKEISAAHLDEFKAAMDTDDKNVRDAALLPIMDKIAEEHPDLDAATLDLISYKMQKYVVRRWLLDEGKRVDGRGINEIRPLNAEVGLLPRVHGSGLFTRGQTQSLTICTLGSTRDAQTMDDLGDMPTKRYIHHYNMPPYSTGEARAPRSPGRREIGHGALAERALIPVLPSMEEFPYTIRCVSEIMSSNGSTSQASICGSTLALMDAGVPIKAPVAGISCGLITEGERWMTMLDIQGVEDFHGDMDFKVGGTRRPDLRDRGGSAGEVPQGPPVHPGRDHQALHRRTPQGAVQVRAQDVQHADPRGQDQGRHRQGRQGHPGDVRQLQLQDRHRGGRPRLYLGRGHRRRQAGHFHHQDHRGGPRGGRHLQGPRDPADELRRVC